MSRPRSRVLVAAVVASLLSAALALAQCDPPPFTEIARVYYHLGVVDSATMLSQPNGTRIESTQYLPYGSVATIRNGSGGTIGATQGAFGFTSQRPPDALDVAYFHRRYYAPALGVFLSPDPAGQFPDPYSYADGDPLNRLDPTGREFIGVGMDGRPTFGPSHAASAAELTEAAHMSLYLMALLPLPITALEAGGLVVADHALSLAAGEKSVRDIAKEAVTSIAINQAVGAVSHVTGSVVKAVVGKEAGTAEKTVAAAAKTAVTDSGEAARGATTVIGRTKNLGDLAAGERSLLDRLTPDLGSAKANWTRNSGVLREEMDRRLPIRDASPGDTEGIFLNAERALLEERGWTFNPQTNYWIPPEPEA